MESLDPKCTALKTRYEECFRSWYSNTYLPAADPTKVKDECRELFEEYRGCLQGMLEAKGIDKMLLEKDVLE
jgi:TRIAP1/MDM35 family protein